VIEGPTEPFHILEGTLLTFHVNAFDPDSGDVVTLSMVSGPSGATFVGNQFSWTPSYAGEYTVQLQASDGKGGFDTRNISIIVDALHFPLEDLQGQFFGVMIGGRALEVFLGQPTFGDVSLRYVVVSGPGAAGTQQRMPPPSPRYLAALLEPLDCPRTLLHPNS